MDHKGSNGSIMVRFLLGGIHKIRLFVCHAMNSKDGINIDNGMIPQRTFGYLDITSCRILLAHGLVHNFLKKLSWGFIRAL